MPSTWAPGIEEVIGKGEASGRKADGSSDCGEVVCWASREADAVMTSQTGDRENRAASPCHICFVLLHEGVDYQVVGKAPLLGEAKLLLTLKLVQSGGFSVASGCCRAVRKEA